LRNARFAFAPAIFILRRNKYNGNAGFLKGRFSSRQKQRRISPKATFLKRAKAVRDFLKDVLKRAKAIRDFLRNVHSSGKRRRGIFRKRHSLVQQKRGTFLAFSKPARNGNKTFEALLTPAKAVEGP
jgi:hypothetical protein